MISSETDLDDEERRRAETALDALGGQLEHASNFHCFAIVVDDAVVVSSADPLSNPANPTSAGAGYGLVLRGAEPADAVVARLLG